MSLPTPTGTSGGNYPDFLKAEHFPKNATKGKLLVTGIREAVNSKYSDVFVDVLLGKKSYTWGLSAGDRAYTTLFARFGKTESKWKGIVNVALVTKGKNTYINVVG